MTNTTTKISYCSDIHLEFSNINLENSSNAQILILAGDICTAKQINHTTVKSFFDNVCEQWSRVIYVLGNHEHYNNIITNTYQELSKALNYPNLYILDNSIVEINNIIFAGTTLWTNCNNNDSLTTIALNKNLNDYKKIFINEYQNLNTTNTINLFNQNLLWLKNITNHYKNNPICVISHHAPSRLSIHEKYKNNYTMNGAFSSQLDSFITNNTNIKYWIHGHTHDEFDYYINQTHVLCNPRGYCYNNTKENPQFLLKEFLI